MGQLRQRSVAGWHTVTEKTSLYIDRKGQPIAICSTERNLDDAENHAAEFFGGPLGLSAWSEVNEREGVTHMSPINLVNFDPWFAAVTTYAIDDDTEARDVTP
jgi:hypothetical protein